MAVFGVMVSAVVLVLLVGFGGYVDYFYVKFTSGPQRSLILGDSRAFQGIRPDLLDAETGRKFEGNTYNYAFTMGQAAYGDAYLESVRRKLDLDTKNGLFILTVQPWILSERTSDDVQNGKFFESDLPPHNMRFPNMNPNLEYFFRNQDFFHFKAVFRKVTRTHENGWLEERHVKKSKDEQTRLLEVSISQYEGFAQKWKPSDYRMKKLAETVRFLKNHGKVVLVRMPVSRDIVDVERSYWKDFDSEISGIAKSLDASYLDYSGRADDFVTYDGIHLDKENIDKFSTILGTDIMQESP